MQNNGEGNCSFCSPCQSQSSLRQDHDCRCYLLDHNGFENPEYSFLLFSILRQHNLEKLTNTKCCFTNLRPADPIYLDVYHRERIICSVIFHSTHHILHIKNIRFACPNTNHYHPYQIQFSGKNNQ